MSISVRISHCPWSWINIKIFHDDFGEWGWGLGHSWWQSRVTPGWGLNLGHSWAKQKSYLLCYCKGANDSISKTKFLNLKSQPWIVTLNGKLNIYIWKKLRVSVLWEVLRNRSCKKSKLVVTEFLEKEVFKQNEKWVLHFKGKNLCKI